MSLCCSVSLWTVRSKNCRTMAVFAVVFLASGWMLERPGRLAAQAGSAIVHGEGGVTCRTEQVPMRDGTRLATDVYLPAAPGRYPVVMQRTPYGLKLGHGCHVMVVAYGIEREPRVQLFV
jgi:predicted acyl esterase